MMADVPRWSGIPFELDGDPAATLASLARVTAVGRRARVVSSTEHSIVLEDRWWPVGVRMLAIGLFPFGLVALLYRRRGQLTISVRPGSSGRTTVWVTGAASRLVSAAMWRLLGELSPAAPSTGLVGSARTGRLYDTRRTAERVAGAHPWLFSVASGVIVFLLLSSLSSFRWKDVVGNAIFSLLIVGIAARALRLWPHNRVINWHSSRLPVAHREPTPN
jgi:hypothetical protein